MSYRASEEHKLWLFDLRHGNLPEQDIVPGFLRYYILEGLELGHVQNDLQFRTIASPDQIRLAMRTLKAALVQAAGITEGSAKE